MVEPAPKTRDRLALLEELLPELPAARERVALGDELKRVGEWLQQQSTALESFELSCTLCSCLARDAGPAEHLTVLEALQVIEGFANTLAEAQDERGLKAILQEAKDARTEIYNFNSALRRVYGTVLSAKLQPLGSTGDLIIDLDPSSTLGARLIAFAVRASEIIKATHAQFAAGVLNTFAEAESLKAEIGLLATEPEQMAFLEALVAGKATLRLLTPSVLEWLGRLGALDRFVIRPQAHR